MEIILSYVDFVWWVFSPIGIMLVLVVSGLLLSGLPGAIMPNVEATAASRSRLQSPQALGSHAPTVQHGERMGA